MIIQTVIFKYFNSFTIGSMFESESFLIISRFCKFIIDNKEDESLILAFRSLMSELIEKEMFYEIDEIVVDLYEIDKSFLINIIKTLTPEVSSYASKTMYLWDKQGQP